MHYAGVKRGRTVTREEHRSRCKFGWGSSMNYYLGFDGGGTKTQCVVIDEDGRVLGQGAAGPSNPLRVGFREATIALTNAATAALASADLPRGRLRGVCAGLAGAGRPRIAADLRSFLRENFPGSFVHATTDLEVTLEAAAGAGPGVVLVAGTGSAACGRNAAGELVRAGGHGPWVGDRGSAFDIGRRAVMVLASAFDLGASPPPLADGVLAALGLSGWDELIARIAQAPDEVFPRLFQVVVEVAEAGDKAAREILVGAAAELTDLAAAVIRRLDLGNAEFLLVKSGGVFGRSALLDSPLDAGLGRMAPQARISLLQVPAAVGAARLARRLDASQPGSAAHAE